MKNTVMDFLMAALPWIGIGLFAAINIVKKQVESKEINAPVLKKLSMASLVSFACFVFVAAMEFADGDQNSATVWMCLAIINFVFYNVNHREGIMEEGIDDKKEEA